MPHVRLAVRAPYSAVNANALCSGLSDLLASIGTNELGTDSDGGDVGTVCAAACANDGALHAAAVVVASVIGPYI